MKIHFAQPQFSEFKPWESDLLDKLEAEFNQTRCAERFRLVKDPAEAELIMFFESGNYKFRTHAANLAKEPLLKRFAEKAVTYNYSDAAAGFVDGIYVYLERHRSDPAHFRASPDLLPHNHLVYSVDDDAIFGRTPKNFLTFRGSLSHKLRRQIVDHFEGAADRGIKMTVIDRWYNHSPDEKQSYLDELLDSKFVLCPRGISSGTPRIYETMAMGRVPVIIADSWVPYHDLDLNKVAVRIPEKDFRNTERILREIEPKWDEMRRHGRLYWTSRYAKDRRLESLLDCSAALLKERPSAMTYEQYLARWSSLSFAWANQWTFPQRVLRKVFRR